MPAIAEQQPIYGDVQVVVSIDESSRITAVAIQNSPSAVLNRAALDAARNSTFHVEIRNCKPVAADFLFVVNFSI
jgi:TonB family protein